MHYKFLFDWPKKFGPVYKLFLGQKPYLVVTGELFILIQYVDIVRCIIRQANSERRLKRAEDMPTILRIGCTQAAMGHLDLG